MNGDIFNPGDRIIYVPMHAHGDITHKDVERGVVVRQSEISGTVFARFYRNGVLKEQAQGCNTSDLRKENI
jgi:hypothetical protein